MCKCGSMASLYHSMYVCLKCLKKKSFYSLLIKGAGKGGLGRLEGDAEALDCMAAQAVALGQRGKVCLQRGHMRNPEHCA